MYAQVSIEMLREETVLSSLHFRVIAEINLSNAGIFDHSIQEMLQLLLVGKAEDGLRNPQFPSCGIRWMVPVSASQIGLITRIAQGDLKYIYTSCS